MAVFEARPEAIKVVPLIIELKKNSNIETIVCVTGQHKEMLDQVMSTFTIIPDYNLHIMKNNLTLEGVEAGFLKLVGTNTNIIVNEAQLLLDDATLYNKMSKASNSQANGFASQRIVEILDNNL